MSRMVGSIEVYVPCDVVTVTVTVAPEDHLSPLELLFLRATCRGVSSFADLTELFGLGQRLTLDLVFDLWRARFIDVDMAQAAVLPTPAVLEAFGADRLETLRSAEARDEPRKVMQELLTGHVLNIARSRPVRIQAKTAVPVDIFDVGLAQLSPGALLAALREAVEREGEDGSRRSKIFSAHLAASNLRSDGERRWLPVRIRPSVDPDSGQLSVEVLDESLPLPVRSRMADHLSLVGEQRPESPFVRFLREQDRREVPVRTEVRPVLGKLERDVTELASVQPALRAQRHGELVASYEEVQAWCIERLGNEVDVRVIADVSAHEDEVVRLLKGAMRQVVIASPWVRRKGLERILPALREALAREVQTYLLWGIDREAPLDAEVLNYLTHLKSEFPHHLHFTERSSGTHAKLVIQDDAKALVGSWNILGAQRAETFELSVVVARAAPERECRTIEELLAWAQSTYPDYVESQLMYTLAEDFDLARDRTRALAAEPLAGVSDVGPPQNPGVANLDPAMDASVAKLWEREWRSAIDYLTTVEAAARDQTATVRRDGHHREVLWSALRDARFRLLICSDQLGPEVVDDRFISTLETRLDEGLHIALVWQRLSGHVSEGPSGTVERLQALAARWPGQLTLIGSTPTHAKIVVADDVAVVTSFNFLSFEGYYERGPAGVRRQRSELGLEITGARTADDVVEAVATRFSPALDHFPKELAGDLGPAPAAIPDPPVSRALDVLLQAMTEPDDAERLAQLRKALQESPDVSGLLSELAEVGLPAELLRPTVASALLLTDLDATERDSWLGWLAADAWRRHDFVEAAALAGAFEDGRPMAEAPTRLEALAFASLGSPSFEEAALAVLDAAGQHGDQRSCLALAAVLALLFDGEPACEELVTGETGLPAAWEELLAAASDYWNYAYEALPLARIQQAVDAARQRAAENDAWDALQSALESAESKNFAFGSGKKTRTFLYRADGSFGRLRKHADAQDADGVRAWVAEHQAVDIDDFLDDATRAATGRDDQLFVKGTRKEYLTRISQVFAAAEMVANAVPSEIEEESSIRMRAAADLAVRVRQLWDDLKASLDDAVQPTLTAAEVALQRLRPLREWNP